MKDSIRTNQTILSSISYFAPRNAREQPPVPLEERRRIGFSEPETFEAVLRDLIAKGFATETLLAAIARQEFTLRERDFGVSNGVVYAMSSLSTWLYDDSAATDALTFSEHFTALREAAGTGYFEELAEKVFLANPHRCVVHLTPITPDKDTAEAERRAEAAAAKPMASASLPQHISPYRSPAMKESPPPTRSTMWVRS